MLKKYTIRTEKSGDSGYIGRSMSVNAKQAYERGLKPLSRIRAADLKQNGFDYSVKFFRWLICNWDIKPKEMHHTSAAYNLTAFYDASVIRYVVRYCNLEILRQIYRGKLTMEQARQKREIRYAEARILDTLIGGNAGKVIKVNCVLCDKLLFLSPRLCIRAESSRVEIVRIFDGLPEWAHNENVRKITNNLIKYKTSRYFRYLRK